MFFEQIELEPLDSFIEDFLMSFNVASGSLSAHALAIKGLSLRDKISPIQVVEKLITSYHSLSGDQKKAINFRMAQSHKHNDWAKNTLSGLAKHETFNIDDALLEQLPANNELLDLQRRVETNSSVSMEKIDKALLNILGSKNYAQITLELKYLATFLGLYTGTQWWNHLDEKKQIDMIEAGNKLYIQTNG